MYDLAQPADRPGRCPKCRGTGKYSWGGTVNGKPAKQGHCFSCNGTGRQSAAQISRNHAYNRYKINLICAGI